MNAKQKTIHDQAIKISKLFRQCEVDLVEILSQAEINKVHHALDKPSMFVYATEELGLSDATAYSSIAVARKSRQFAALRTALEQQTLSVSKASRIVSILDKENVDELVDFASKNTQRKIDFEVARRNPKSVRDKVTPISEDYVVISLTVHEDDLKNFERAQAVTGLRGGEAFAKILNRFLDIKDPVRKADRATRKKDFCAHRKPLTAEQKHAVFQRDRGRCTKCGSEHWVEVHHIIPIAMGGSNEPENLTTLCGFHHGQIHKSG